MREGPGHREKRLTKSWNYLQSKASGGKPESTGGLIALYLAVVGAVATYYLFR